MGKIIIIGSGPAGVSAALYAKRGGADVLVIAKGIGALEKAELIQNYYGLETPVSGAELSRRGIVGAKSIGVVFREDEILALDYGQDLKGFKAVAKDSVYEADSIIIAAGAARKTLNLPGLKELTGRGVSYCATCDGFLYRGKRVAVLGAGDYARHEVEALLPHAAQAYILTNGEPIPESLPAGVEAKPAKLTAVNGEKKLTSVGFEDGSSLELDGLFVALGTAGSADLARKLGVMPEGGSLKVDAHMATTVPGVFAAGDATGGLLQVAKAVYQGAEAGLAAVNYLRQQKQQK